MPQRVESCPTAALVEIFLPLSLSLRRPIKALKYKFNTIVAQMKIRCSINLKKKKINKRNEMQAKMVPAQNADALMIKLKGACFAVAFVAVVL